MAELNRTFSLIRKVLPANGNNFVEIFTPTTQGQVKFDAFLIEFTITIDLVSISSIPELEPGDLYETTAQANYRYTQQLNDHPVKQLGIYFSNPGESERTLKFRVTCWSAPPGYQEPCLAKLAPEFQYALVANGAKIWARVESSTTGALSGQDNISISIAGIEFSEDIQSINGSIPSSTIVGTQSQIIIAANANRKLVSIVNRGDSIVYLNLGATATSGAGIGLNPGGSSFILNTNEINYTGAISAIVATGQSRLEILEAS